MDFNGYVFNGEKSDNNEQWLGIQKSSGQLLKFLFLEKIRNLSRIVFDKKLFSTLFTEFLDGQIFLVSLYKRMLYGQLSFEATVYSWTR